MSNLNVLKSEHSDICRKLKFIQIQHVIPLTERQNQLENQIFQMEKTEAEEQQKALTEEKPKPEESKA